MGEVIHTAKIRLVQEETAASGSAYRRIRGAAAFGTHGGYAKYYGVKDTAPLPTTIDHVISALAG